MLVNVADDEEMRYPFLHIIASVLAWASAVINPFIYAFKNRQYQQAFAKVIIIIHISTNVVAGVGGGGGGGGVRVRQNRHQLQQEGGGHGLAVLDSSAIAMMNKSSNSSKPTI
jgi:hypothetical protein